MVISQQRLADLISVLDSILPNDVGDIKANRKVNDAVKALKKSAKPYTDAFEALNDEVQEYSKPYQKKIAELNQKLQSASEEEKKELEAELKAVEAEGNAGLIPINEKLIKLAKEEGEKEVEFMLDPNVLTEVKNQFTKHAPAKFRNRAAFCEVADALQIDD